MESSSNQRDILREVRHDRVLLLTLNRPESRNALNRELIAALQAAVGRFAADDALGVLLLTGADPAFCAGLDLRELSQRDAPPMGGGEMIHAVAALGKPVIGAVNGPAVTGGLELALACDFLIASERATFADTHARVGVLPGGGLSARLPQAVGLRLARQMSYSGDYLSSARALASGLVNEVVEHDGLLSRALEVAQTIAANHGDLVQELKSIYARGSLSTLADALTIESEAVAARRAAGRQFAKDVASVIGRGRRQQASAAGAGPA